VIDGNYFLNLHDINYRHMQEHMASLYGKNKSLDFRTNVNNVDLDRCTRLAEGLPLAKEFRPAWDVSLLSRLGFTNIEIHNIDADDFVYDTAYGPMHTPVHFGLCARLPMSNRIVNIHDAEEDMAFLNDSFDKGVDSINETWKILSNRDCVKLLLSLYVADLTASQAAEILGCSYSLASHDLKILIDSGFVSSRRENGMKVYRLEKRGDIRHLCHLTMMVNNERTSDR
jgi:DNA-binding transcriptional ArsR family regulator